VSVRKRPTWFAAVQIQENEDAHKAVWELFQVVDKAGIKFTALEVFSVDLIARARFVRFRSDLDLSLVQDQLTEAGIGYISFTEGVNGPTYEALMAGGVRGRVPMERMHLTRFCTEVAAAVMMWVSTSRRKPYIPTGLATPVCPSTE